jgi:nitric oxide reductase NorE protein
MSSRLPGRHHDIPIAERGIWIFVGVDLAIFALFFLVYLIERKAAPEVFQHAQARLDPGFGFVNTLALLTSSWLLVRSIRCIDTGTARSRHFLAGSIVFGMLFIVSKLIEYSDKYQHGIGVAENTFFTFYYVLTFIHLLHVMAGLIALSVMYSWLRSGEGLRRKGFYQSLGIYWHMVDLLWIYLFLLLYLIR